MMNKKEKTFSKRRIFYGSSIFFSFGVFGFLGWLIFVSVKRNNDFVLRKNKNSKVKNNAENLVSDSSFRSLNYQSWKARIYEDKIVVFDQYNNIVKNYLQILKDINPSLTPSVINNYDVAKKSYEKYGDYRKWIYNCPPFTRETYFEDDLNFSFDETIWIDWRLEVESNNHDIHIIDEPLAEAKKQDERITSFDMMFELQEWKNKCISDKSKEIYGTLLGKNANLFFINMDYERQVNIFTNDNNIEEKFIGFDVFNKHMRLQGNFQESYYLYNIENSGVDFYNLQENKKNFKRNSETHYGNFETEKIFVFRNPLNSQYLFWVFDKKTMFGFEELNRELNFQIQTKHHQYDNIDDFLNDFASKTFNISSEGNDFTKPYYGSLYKEKFVTQCVGIKDVDITNKQRIEYCKDAIDFSRLSILGIIQVENKIEDIIFNLEYKGVKHIINNVILNAILWDQSKYGILEKYNELYKTDFLIPEVASLSDNLDAEVLINLNDLSPIFLNFLNNDGEISSWVKNLNNYDEAFASLKKEISLEKTGNLFLENDNINKNNIFIKSITFDNDENITDILFTFISGSFKNKSITLEELNYELKEQKNDFVDLTLSDIDADYNNFSFAKSLSLYGNLKEDTIFIDFNSLTKEFSFQINDKKKIITFKNFIDELNIQIGEDFSFILIDFGPDVFKENNFKNYFFKTFKFSNFENAKSLYFIENYGDWTSKTNYHVENYSNDPEEITFVLNDDPENKIVGLNKLEEKINLLNGEVLIGDSKEEKLNQIDKYVEKKSRFKYGDLYLDGKINKENISIYDYQDFENIQFLFSDHIIIDSITLFNQELTNQGSTEIFSITNVDDFNGFKNGLYIKSIYNHGQFNQWVAKQVLKEIKIYNLKDQEILNPEEEIFVQTGFRSLESIINYQLFFNAQEKTKELLEEENVILESIDFQKNIERDSIDEKVLYIEEIINLYQTKIEALNNFYEKYLQISIETKNFYILDSKLFDSWENIDLYQEKLINLQAKLEALQIVKESYEILLHPYMREFEVHYSDYHDDQHIEIIDFFRGEKLNVEAKIKKVNDFLNSINKWKIHYADLDLETLENEFFTSHEIEKIDIYHNFLQTVLKSIEKIVFLEKAKEISSTWTRDEIFDWISKVEEFRDTQKITLSPQEQEKFERSFEVKLKFLLDTNGKGWELLDSLPDLTIDPSTLSCDEILEKNREIISYFEKYDALNLQEKEFYDNNVDDANWKKHLQDYQEELMTNLKKLLQEKVDTLEAKILDFNSYENIINSLEENIVGLYSSEAESLIDFFDNQLNSSEKNSLQIEWIDENKQKLNNALSDLIASHEAIIINLKKPDIIALENFKTHFGDQFEDVNAMKEIISKVKTEISHIEYHIEIYNSLNDYAKNIYSSEDPLPEFNVYLQNLKDYLEGLKLFIGIPEIIPLEIISIVEDNPGFRDSLKNTIQAKINEFEFFITRFNDLTPFGKTVFDTYLLISDKESELKDLIDFMSGMMLHEEKPSILSDISMMTKDQTQEEITDIELHIDKYNALNTNASYGYGEKNWVTLLENYKIILSDRYHGLSLKEKFASLIEEDIKNFDLDQIENKFNAINDHLNDYDYLQEYGISAYEINTKPLLENYKDRLHDRKNGLLLKDSKPLIKDSINTLNKEQIDAEMSLINNHIDKYNNLKTDGEDAYDDFDLSEYQEYLDNLHDRKEGLLLKEKTLIIPDDITDFSISDVETELSKIFKHIDDYNALSSDGKEAYSNFDLNAYQDYENLLVEHKNGLILKSKKPPIINDITAFSLEEIKEEINKIDLHFHEYNHLSATGKNAYNEDPNVTLDPYRQKLYNYQKGLELKNKFPVVEDNITSFSIVDINTKVNEIDSYLTTYDKLNAIEKAAYGDEPRVILNPYKNRLLNRKTGLELLENLPATPSDITSFTKDDVDNKVLAIDAHISAYNALDVDGKAAYGPSPETTLNIYKDRLLNRKTGLELFDNLPATPLDITSFTKDNVDNKVLAIDDHISAYHALDVDGKAAYGSSPETSLNIYKERLLDRKTGLELFDNLPATPLDITSFTKDNVDNKVLAIDDHISAYNALDVDGKAAYGSAPETTLNIYKDRLLDRQNGLQLLENLPATPSNITSFTKDSVDNKILEIDNHISAYHALDVDGKAAYGPAPQTTLNIYKERLLDHQNGLQLFDNLPATPSDITSFTKDNVDNKVLAIDAHISAYNALDADGKTAYGSAPETTLNAYKERILDHQNGLELLENLPATPSDITSFTKDSVDNKIVEIDNHINAYNALDVDGKAAYGPSPETTLNIYKERLLDHQNGLELFDNFPETPSDIISFTKEEVDTKITAIDAHLNAYNNLDLDGKAAYGSAPQTILNIYKDRLLDHQNGLQLLENFPATPSDITSFTKEEVDAKITTIDAHLNAYNNLDVDGKVAYGPAPETTLNIYKERLLDHQTGLELFDNLPETPSDITSFTKDSVDNKIVEIDNHINAYHALDVDGKAAYGSAPETTLNIYKGRLLDHQKGLELFDNFPETPSDIISFTKDNVDAKITAIDAHLNAYNNLDVDGKAAYGPAPQTTLNAYKERLLDHQNGLELLENLPETPSDITSLSFEDINAKVVEIDTHLGAYNNLDVDGKAAYGDNPTLTLTSYKENLLNFKIGLSLIDNVPTTPLDITSFTKDKVNAKIAEIDAHLNAYHALDADGKTAYGPAPETTLNAYKDRLLDHKMGLELLENLPETPSDITSFIKEEIDAKALAIDNHINAYNALDVDGKAAYGPAPEITLNIYKERLLNRKNGLKLFDNLPETPSDITSFTKDDVDNKALAIDVHISAYHALDVDGKVAYGPAPETTLNIYKERLLDHQNGLELLENLPATPLDITSFTKDDVDNKVLAIDAHISAYNALDVDGKAAYDPAPETTLNIYKERLLDHQNGLELFDNLPETPLDITSFTKEEVDAKVLAIDDHINAYNALDVDGKAAYGLAPQTTLNIYKERLLDHQNGLELFDNLPATPSDITSFTKEEIDAKALAIDDHISVYNALDVDGKVAYGPAPETTLNIYKERLLDRKNGLQLFDNLPATPSDITPFTKDDVDAKVLVIDNHINAYHALDVDGKVAYGPAPETTLNIYKERLLDHQNGLQLFDNLPATPSDITSFTKDDVDIKVLAIDNHINAYHALDVDGKAAYGPAPETTLNIYKKRLLDRKNGLQLLENLPETPSDITSFTKDNVDAKITAIDAHLNAYNNLDLDGKAAYGPAPQTTLNIYKERLLDHQNGLQLLENLPGTPSDITSFTKDDVDNKVLAIDAHISAYHALDVDGKAAYGSAPETILNAYKERLLDHQNGLHLLENLPEIPSDIASLSFEDINAKVVEIDTHLDAYNNLDVDGKAAYGDNPTLTLTSYKENLLNFKIGLSLIDNVPTTPLDITSFTKDEVNAKIAAIDAHLNAYNALDVDGKAAYGDNPNSRFEIYKKRLLDHQNGLELLENLLETPFDITSFTKDDVNNKVLAIDAHISAYHALDVDGKAAYGSSPETTLNIYKERLLDHQNGLELLENLPATPSDITSFTKDDVDNKVLAIDAHISAYNALDVDGKAAYGPSPETTLNIYKDRLLNRKTGLELFDNLPATPSDITSFTKDNVDNKVLAIDTYLDGYNALDVDGKAAYGSAPETSLNIYKERLLDHQTGLELFDNLPATPSDITSFTKDNVNNKVLAIDDHINAYNALDVDGKAAYGPAPETTLNIYKERLLDHQNGLQLLENLPATPSDITSFTKDDVDTKALAIDDHISAYNALDVDGKAAYGPAPETTLNIYKERLLDHQNGLQLLENLPATPSDITSFTKDNVDNKVLAIDNHISAYHALDVDGKAAYGSAPETTLNIYKERLLDHQNGLQLLENLPATPLDITSFTKDDVNNKVLAIDNHINAYNALDVDGKAAYGPAPETTLNIYKERLLDHQNGLQLLENLPETPSDITSFTKEEVDAKVLAIDNHINAYNALDVDGKAAYGPAPETTLNIYKERLLDHQNGLQLLENFPATPSDITSFTKEDIDNKALAIDAYINAYHALDVDGKAAYGSAPETTLNIYKERLLDRKNGLKLLENLPETPSDITSFTKDDVDAKITAIDAHITAYNALDVDGKAAYGSAPEITLNIYKERLFDHQNGLELLENLPDIPSDITSFTKDNVDAKITAIDAHLNAYNALDVDGKAAYGSAPETTLNTYKDRLLDHQTGLQLLENLPETPSNITSFTKDDVDNKVLAIDNHINAYHALDVDGKAAYGPAPQTTLNTYKERLLDHQNGLQLLENLPETPSDITSFTKDDVDNKVLAIDAHIDAYNTLNVDGKAAYGSAPETTLNIYKERLLDHQNGLQLLENLPETPSDITSFTKDDVDTKALAIDNHISAYHDLDVDGKAAYGSAPETTLNIYKERLLDHQNGLQLLENLPATPSDITSFTKDNVDNKVLAIDAHISAYNALDVDGKAAYGDNPTLTLTSYKENLLNFKIGLSLIDNVPTTPLDITSFTKDEANAKIAAIDAHISAYHALDVDGKTAYGPAPETTLNAYKDRLLDHQTGLQLLENLPGTPSNITSFTKDDVDNKVLAIDNHINAYHALDVDGKAAYGSAPETTLNIYKERLLDHQKGLQLLENLPETPSDITSFTKDDVDVKVLAIDAHIDAYHALNVDGKAAYGPAPETTLNAYKERLLDHQNGLQLLENLPETPSDITLFTKDDVDNKVLAIDNHINAYHALDVDGKAAYGPAPETTLNIYKERLFDHQTGLELFDNLPATPLDITSFTKDNVDAKITAIDAHLNAYNNLDLDGKAAYGPAPETTLNIYKERLLDHQNGLQLFDNLPGTPSDITSFTKDDVDNKVLAIDAHINAYHALDVDGKAAYGLSPETTLNTYKDRLLNRKIGLELKLNSPTITPVSHPLTISEINAKIITIDAHLENYNNLDVDGQIAYDDDITIATSDLNVYKEKLLNFKFGLELKNNQPEILDDATFETYNINKIYELIDLINEHFSNYNSLNVDGKNGYNENISLVDNPLSVYHNKLWEYYDKLELLALLPDISKSIADYTDHDEINNQVDAINQFFVNYNALTVDQKKAFDEINLNIYTDYKNNLLDHQNGLIIKDSAPEILETINSLSESDISEKITEIDNHLYSYNTLGVYGKDAYGIDPNNVLTIYKNRLTDRQNGLILLPEKPTILADVSTLNETQINVIINQINVHHNNYNNLDVDGKEAYGSDPTLSTSDLNVYKQKLNDSLYGLQFKDELENLLAIDVLATTSITEINAKIADIDAHIEAYKTLNADQKAAYANPDPKDNVQLDTKKKDLLQFLDGLQLKEQKDILYNKYSLHDVNSALFVTSNEEIIQEITIINNHLQLYNNLSPLAKTAYGDDLTILLNNYKNRLLEFENGLTWLEDEKLIAESISSSPMEVSQLATFNVNTLGAEQISLWKSEVEILKNDYVSLNQDGKAAVNKDVANDATLPINILYKNLLKLHSINNYGDYSNWTIQFNSSPESEANMYFTSTNIYGDNVVISNAIHANELIKQEGTLDGIPSYLKWKTKQIYGDLWNLPIDVTYNSATNLLEFQVSGKQKISGIDLFNEKLDLLINGTIDTSDDHTEFGIGRIGLTLNNYLSAGYDWSIWRYGGEIYGSPDWFCNSWNTGCENFLHGNRISISKIIFDTENSSYIPIDYQFKTDNHVDAIIKNLQDFDTLLRWHGYNQVTLTPTEHIRDWWLYDQYNAVKSEQENRHSLDTYGSLLIDGNANLIDKSKIYIDRIEGRNTDVNGFVSYFNFWFRVYGKETIIKDSTAGLLTHLRKQGYTGPDINDATIDNTWNEYDYEVSIINHGFLFSNTIPIKYSTSSNTFKTNGVFFNALTWEELNDQLDVQKDQNPVDYTTTQQMRDAGILIEEVVNFDKKTVILQPPFTDHALLNSSFNIFIAVPLVFALIIKGFKSIWKKIIS